MNGIVNKTTTQLYAASPLAGADVLGIVQDGANKKSTIAAIATYTLHSLAPTVGIGLSSSVSGNSIAIGTYSDATATESIAIGPFASAGNSYYRSKIAIGDHARACRSYAIAIGRESYASNYGSLAFGNHIYSAAPTSIAIGNYAAAFGEGSLTICNIGSLYNGGNGAIAIGGGMFIGMPSQATCSVAIGVETVCEDQYSVAIGFDNINTSQKSVTIGYKAYADAAYSVAIGANSYVNNAYCIAIGYNARSMGYCATAIGYNAFAPTYMAVSIGYSAYAVGQQAIAIGTYAGAPSNHGVAIGADSHANLGGTAIGWRAYGGNYSVGFGYAASAPNNFSIAIGCQVTTSDTNAMAFGHNTHAACANSIVLGQGAVDFTKADFVVRGGVGSHNGPLSPTTHDQKFYGSTVVPTKAVATFGNEAFTITVTYDTPGTAGNSLFVSVLENAPNDSLQASLQVNTLVVLLATDNDNISTTTVNDFVALFPTNGFSCTATGDLATILHQFTSTGFGSGTDSPNHAFLTSDGGSLTEVGDNTPTLGNSSIARCTGQVIAYEPSYTDTLGGKAVTFSLAPCFIARDNTGHYAIVGSSAFSFEFGSDGTSGWTAPLFGVTGSGTALALYAVGQAMDLNWLCFLHMESNL